MGVEKLRLGEEMSGWCRSRDSVQWWESVRGRRPQGANRLPVEGGSQVVGNPAGDSTPQQATAKDLSVLSSSDALSAGVLGFMPRRFVLTILPHRQPTSYWFERDNGRHSLRLTAPRRIGLPYGSYPRPLLACLTTGAVRTKSPQIDLGATPNDLARRLGLSTVSGPRGAADRLHETSSSCRTRRRSFPKRSTRRSRAGSSRAWRPRHQKESRPPGGKRSSNRWTISRPAKSTPCRGTL